MISNIICVLILFFTWSFISFLLFTSSTSISTLKTHNHTLSQLTNQILKSKNKQTKGKKLYDYLCSKKLTWDCSSLSLDGYICEYIHSCSLVLWWSSTKDIHISHMNITCTASFFEVGFWVSAQRSSKLISPKTVTETDRDVWDIDITGDSSIKKSNQSDYFLLQKNIMWRLTS